VNSFQFKDVNFIGIYIYMVTHIRWIPNFTVCNEPRDSQQNEHTANNNEFTVWLWYHRLRSYRCLYLFYRGLIVVCICFIEILSLFVFVLSRSYSCLYLFYRELIVTNTNNDKTSIKQIQTTIRSQ
jgi:hypothetical protein